MFQSQSLQTLIGGLFALLVPLIASGQEPIETARSWPPGYVKNSKLALVQIDWRLQHLQDFRLRQLEKYQQLAAELDANRIQKSALMNKLPIELQFADNRVRSELVGDCLSALLASKLELASNEELIEQLEAELEKTRAENAVSQKLMADRSAINIRASEAKVELSEQEYAAIKKLHAKGAKTQQELRRSQYTLEIAKLELRQAEVEREIERSSRVNEISQRLVEARLGTEPLRARVKAAEKFLAMISASKQFFDEIKVIERRFDRQSALKDAAATRLLETEEQITELKVLQKLVASAAPPEEDDDDQ